MSEALNTSSLQFLGVRSLLGYALGVSAKIGNNKKKLTQTNFTLNKHLRTQPNYLKGMVNEHVFMNVVSLIKNFNPHQF